MVSPVGFHGVGCRLWSVMKWPYRVLGEIVSDAVEQEAEGGGDGGLGQCEQEEGRLHPSTQLLKHTHTHTHTHIHTHTNSPRHT